jgi:hypothetical protein
VDSYDSSNSSGHTGPGWLLAIPVNWHHHSHILDLFLIFSYCEEGFRCRCFKSRLYSLSSVAKLCCLFFKSLYRSFIQCELVCVCVSVLECEDCGGYETTFESTDLYAAFLSYCAHPHASHVSCLFKYTGTVQLLPSLLIDRPLHTWHFHKTVVCL